MSHPENDKIIDNLHDSCERMKESLDSMIFHMQALQILLDPSITIAESQKRVADLKIKFAITDD